jgi:hypothetical protein
MSNSTERRTESRTSNMDGTAEAIQAIKHSLIVDITCAGAGLLMLKNIEGVTGNVSLNVLKPDMSSLSGFIIDADVVWVEENYSNEHRKIGIKFTDISSNDALNKNLSDAIKWLSHKDYYFIHCEIVQN